ncbi:MAG: carbamate kinase [Coriobacteriales bacterium]|jgi:carbamate kinase|nr:carbamate kinase [Coriobacteriales bacterium]
MPKTIVIALGGNALGKNLYEQRIAVANAAKPMAELIAQGHSVAICHGNGPQVGMIDLAFEAASRTESGIHPMPLSTDGAMSQGYIGLGIQKALYRELKARGIAKHAATIVTQVVVDPADPAFAAPSKPIGPFYSEEEARSIMAASPEITLTEDSGRGWRRIVASPEPQDIVEKEVIASMLACGHVVIACGGGGIPVIHNDQGGLDPWEAVIDKDFASEKLAEYLDADMLMVLTAVDQVAIGFGTPDERWLSSVTTAEAEGYIAEGQFAPGSMLPKVQAALRFVRSRAGREALICSLDRAPEALLGKTGTLFVH